MFIIYPYLISVENLDVACSPQGKIFFIVKAPFMVSKKTETIANTLANLLNTLGPVY